MTDDLETADLLGEAPRTPDPGFRVDVLARVAERARHRAAWMRAAQNVTVFTAIGLVFPAAQAAGMTIADVEPLLVVAGVLGVAYLLALVTIEGPNGAWARSRAALRARL